MRFFWLFYAFFSLETFNIVTRLYCFIESFIKKKFIRQFCTGISYMVFKFFSYSEKTEALLLRESNSSLSHVSRISQWRYSKGKRESLPVTRYTYSFIRYFVFGMKIIIMILFTNVRKPSALSVLSLFMSHVTQKAIDSTTSTGQY